ncbi:Vacuolar protein sorting-associated protein 51 [Entophlyctis luteolus]|nr:Vacuolar protein sorting-associated protein 51 [Entophlyctis luteolus]
MSNANLSVSPSVASLAAPHRSATNRARLKNFYNLSTSTNDSAGKESGSDSAAPSPTSASLPPRSVTDTPPPAVTANKVNRPYGPNPMDMDSPFFVPETFLSKCINESNLFDLIQRDNDLVTEIKELDASMKTLVYGNYNKFIAASDTIKEMRIKVDSMEDQMKLLEAKICDVGEGTAKVSDFLAEKRAKITQLSAVHHLLNKLQFVFELPSKLSLSLASNHLREAVLLYTETLPLLSHYNDNLAIFSKISSECSATMEKVTQSLLAAMNASVVAPAQISDCVWLLGLLGREFPSLEDLASVYLSTMNTQMNNLINEAISHTNEMTAPRFSSSDISSGKVADDSEVELAVLRVKHLNSKVLKQISDFQVRFHDMFLAIRDDSSCGFFTQSLSFEDRERLEMELDRLCQNFLDRYFEQIRKFVLPSDIWQCKPAILAASFDAIVNGIVPLRGLTLFLDMNERVKSQAVACIKQIAKTAFGTIQKQYIGELEKISLPDSSAKYVLESASSCLRVGIQDKVFPLLENLVDKRLSFVAASAGGSEGVEGILLLLTQCFEQFWDDLGNELKVLSGQTYDSNPTHIDNLLLLIMSRSALSLATTQINNLFSSFASTVLKSRDGALGGVDPSAISCTYGSSHTKRPANLAVVTVGGGVIAGATSSVSFSKRTNSENEGSAASRTTMDPRTAKVLKCGKALAVEWQETAKNLAFRFVNVATASLCSRVRKYIVNCDWMGMNEPTAPSPEWSELLNEVSLVEQQLKPVFDDEERRDRRAGAPTVSISGSTSPNRLNSSSALKSGKLAKSGSSMFASASSSIGPTQTGSPAVGPKLANRGKFMNTPGFGKFDAMLDNIGRMFEDHPGYFGVAEMSREGILGAILRIVVKCYVEEIRRQTLGSHGLHAVQIDRTLLKQFLDDKNGTSELQRLGGDTQLYALTEDMVASAMKRCVNPILQAQPDIDAVLENLAPPSSKDLLVI